VFQPEMSEVVFSNSLHWMYPVLQTSIIWWSFTFCKLSVWNCQPSPLHNN